MDPKWVWHGLRYLTTVVDTPLHSLPCFPPPIPGLMEARAIGLQSSGGCLAGSRYLRRQNSRDMCVRANPGV